MFLFRFALSVSTGRAALPHKASCCLFFLSPNSRSSPGSQDQKHKQRPYHWILKSSFSHIYPSMPSEAGFPALAGKMKTSLASCLQGICLMMLKPLVSLPLCIQGPGAYVNSATLSMEMPEILCKSRHSWPHSL